MTDSRKKKSSKQEVIKTGDFRMRKHMKDMTVFKPIAHIYNGFSSKFGIPRQSGLADTDAKIVFEPEYRVPEAVRGLEGYSHI